MYFSRLLASLIVQTELLIFFSSISHCSPNLYCYEIYNQHHTNMWCFYVQANVHMGIEHKLMICIHAMFRHQNWKVLNAFLELIPMNISLMYWIKFKRNSSWEILQLQLFHRALENIFWNRDFAGLKCIFSHLNDSLLVQTTYFVVIFQFYFSMLTKLIIIIYVLGLSQSHLKLYSKDCHISVLQTQI